MSLPESPDEGAYLEYSAVELGSFYGSVIEDIVADHVQLINRLRGQVEKLEGELDLAAARIEELSTSARREAA